MSMENTYEKLQKLMNSYVPEFAYQKEGKDPGSVLSNLCAGMIDESAKNNPILLKKKGVFYVDFCANCTLKKVFFVDFFKQEILRKILQLSTQNLTKRLAVSFLS